MITIRQHSKRKQLQVYEAARSLKKWLLSFLLSGLFSENHQILGNTIYDRDSGEIFELHDDIATENPKWWQGHTPIWTSLTQQGFNVSLFHWSKCNVEFKIGEETVMPKYCEQYDNNNTHTDTVEIFETALNASFEDIKKNEIDVAFVYYPNIDNLGQKYSRLRCLLGVKGLVIGFYLGWSGSILRFRKI
mgnify:CR=1 FL=1